MTKYEYQNEREKIEKSEDMCTYSSWNSISINPSPSIPSAKSKQFTFDHVFQPKSTQEEVYNATGLRNRLILEKKSTYFKIFFNFDKIAKSIQIVEENQ